MQSTITTRTDQGTEITDNVTVGDIEIAYGAVVASLDAVLTKAGEFVVRCVNAGKLLSRKKGEVGQGNWTPWLLENCPNIKERTAQRLMKIYEMAKASHRTDLEIQAPLTSIRAVYELLLDDEKKPSSTSTALTQEEKDELREASLIQKVKSTLASFWGVCAKRPPEKWKQEEKQAFLRDLADREQIRRERGWELPAIDIEITETIAP